MNGDEERKAYTLGRVSMQEVLYSVVGQFERFAPVFELCRSVERIAKTKSELGA